MSAADTSGQRAACSDCAAKDREIAAYQSVLDRSHERVLALAARLRGAKPSHLVQALAIVGAATVGVALVCLAVLAARLAGGAS